jgi:hypothetical protein
VTAFGAAGAQHLLPAGEALRRAGDDIWKATDRGTPTTPRKVRSEDVD